MLKSESSAGEEAPQAVADSDILVTELVVVVAGAEAAVGSRDMVKGSSHSYYMVGKQEL